jgi:selenophosphate synthetase-related protein
MLIEEVTAVLGRRPNADELTFIKSVMGSIQIQYPFPGLNSIIMGDGQGSAENGQLIIGLEGKSNIIRTKAKMQCAAQGGKGQLKISFPNAKFLVGDKINSEHRKPVPGDNLIYLKAATDAEVTLLNVWNEAHLSAVTVVNQGGLGVSILSLCAEQELGVDLILTNKRQLGDYNSRNISGFLFSVPTADFKKMNTWKSRWKNLGSFTVSNKITFSYRGNMIGTLPARLFHELQERRLPIIPQTTPKKEHSNANKYVKEPANFKLVLKKLVKAQQDLITLKFTPIRQRITPFTAINSSFVLSASDHPYIKPQEPRVGSMITIANAARHLVCLGVKPVYMAAAFHGGDLNNDTDRWILHELVSGSREAATAFQLRYVNGMITKNNSLHPIVDVITAGAGKVRCSPEFNTPGDFVTMIGSLRGETGSSMYADIIHKNKQVGHPSTIDIVMECRLQEVILQGIAVGLIRSAVNVSRGGLAVAIANSLLLGSDGLGARIHFSRKIRNDELLFGETQGLVVVTLCENDLIEFERICMTTGVPSTTIGRITDDGNYIFNDLINIPVKQLSK